MIDDALDEVDPSMRLRLAGTAQDARAAWRVWVLSDLPSGRELPDLVIDSGSRTRDPE